MASALQTEGTSSSAHDLRKVTELAARWYVFIFLNIYGIGKIMGGQFYRPGHLPPDVAQVPLGQADAFELAWTFMGHSFVYILFIGAVEVIGAWLLLWQRTKLFGVAMLLPVMVNIIVFDIAFLDAYGALASAIIYTGLLLFILACHWPRVTAAGLALVRHPPPHSPKFRRSVRLSMMAAILMALLFAIDQLLVNLLGHGRG